MNKKSNDGNQVGNGLPRDSVRTGDISGWEKRLAAGEHLRTLLKKAPSSGTWTLDIATRQLTVTAAVLRLHNLYPRRETPLSFETFLQSIHPLDRQNVEDAVKAAFTGTTLLVVYRCLDSEGTIRWLEAHGGIYHTSTGDLLKAWVQDITEQKVRELHGDFMEDVTDRIHYIEDPSDILEAAAAAVGSHLGLSHCFFTKIDDRGKLAFVTGDYHPRTPSIAGLIEVGLPGGVCRADLDEGQVVVCEDGEKDVRLLSLECRGWYLDHGFRALVVVPVFEQGQRVALFWAVSDRPRKWNDQEIALVQKAAKRSWSVSEKARMQKHSRKIESELDQQSRLLEAFSAAVQDCLYVFDTEGRIVYANRILLDLWGLTREQAIGKTVRELGYPQDAADTLFHGIQQVIASSNVVRNETSYPGPAGVSSQYENVLSPMFGEDGRVVFIAGASRNVTEHLRAEEALRRSRQRFELLSKVAGELLQTQEPQDKIKQLCGDVMAYLDCQVFLNFLADENKKVLRLHAWSGINEETAKVLDEMPLWDMICQCVAWDGVRIATERMAKPQDLCCDVALSLGLTACACHPLIAGDRVIGTLLFGTYTRTSFADDELSLMKMVAEHVAVSMEQMRLLEELRTARERLESRVAERTMELRDLIRKLIERERLLQEQKTLIKTVLEYLPVGVLVIDGKGRIIEANPAAEKIWDGIRYRSIDQCGEYRAWWTNTGKPLSSNELAGLRALATAEACLNQEIEIEAFDGTRKIILDSAVPILGKNGEITAVVVTMTDITRRKHIELSLKQSEEQLRVLSSRLLTAQENERKSIAREIHDSLGASLSLIKMKVETALEEVTKTPMPAATQALLAATTVIKDSIEDCRRIQMDLRPAMLDDLGVVSAFSWFVRRFKKLFPQINVETFITVEDHDVPEALKITIFRIAQESMNNIIKHSRADRVHFSLRKMDDRIELVIEDNGRGFNLPQALNARAEECGIGLSSMRERSQLSGGAFKVVQS